MDLLRERYFLMVLFGKKMGFKQGRGDIVCPLSLFQIYTNKNDIDEPKRHQPGFQEY